MCDKLQRGLVTLTYAFCQLLLLKFEVPSRLRNETMWNMIPLLETKGAD